MKSDHGVRTAVESLPTYHVRLMNLIMMEGEEVVKASKDSFGALRLEHQPLT